MPGKEVKWTRRRRNIHCLKSNPSKGEKVWGGGATSKRRWSHGMTCSLKEREKRWAMSFKAAKEHSQNSQRRLNRAEKRRKSPKIFRKSPIPGPSVAGEVISGRGRTTRLHAGVKRRKGGKWRSSEHIVEGGGSAGKAARLRPQYLS